MSSYPALQFEQYQSNTSKDRLILFSAPAKAIAQWAGVPRKGWHIRMLYQRWITSGREDELRSFWNEASTPRDDQPTPYILGPTALTIAIHDDAVVSKGKIVLEYTSPFAREESEGTRLSKLAAVVLPKVRSRLEPEQQELLDNFALDPLSAEIPDTEHDYVLEAALQLAQMMVDADWFAERNNLEVDQLREIIEALEALCRPALVVDGQHRLKGAAACENEVWLPVVAIPNCPWTEQIYQFVVINEKAQKVETSLLTDIFGSSLTRGEQRALRHQLERSHVSVEPRIAAVVATRDTSSPFYNMVNIKLPGVAPAGAKPYIPESAIRLLIDGGRGARGWRNDSEFYEEYVKPTIPERADWESWTTGRWRDYWFAFWQCVAEFYNDQARQEKNDPNYLLWNPCEQTNLTRSVTMRLFQSLFMTAAVARIERIKQSREVLLEIVTDDIADEKLGEKIAADALPSTPEAFKASIRDWFLGKGIPVRFFTRTWKASLDDAQGQIDLRDEMEKAFEYGQKDKRYVARNSNVFAVTDKSEADA